MQPLARALLRPRRAAVVLRRPATRASRRYAGGSSSSSSSSKFAWHPLVVTADRLSSADRPLVPDLDAGPEGAMEESLRRRGLAAAAFDRGALERAAARIARIDEAARETKRGRKGGGGCVGGSEEGEERRRRLAEEKSDLERRVVMPFLELPNAPLHRDCPVGDEDVVVGVHGERQPVEGGKSHMELAGDGVLLSATLSGEGEPPAVVLLGEMALLEMEVVERCRSFLLRRGDFEPFSNPDFATSLAVEGCGVDFADGGATLALKEGCGEGVGSRLRGAALHLVGGASLFPFASHFARSVLLDEAPLPKSFFCVGKRYRPASNDDASEPPSLLNASQTTAVELFSLSSASGADRKQHLSDRKQHQSDRKQHLSDRKQYPSDRNQHTSDLEQDMSDQKQHLSGRNQHLSDRKQQHLPDRKDHLIEALRSFYADELRLPHFRLVARAPRRLARAEAYRVAVEAPSTSSPGGYAEIASVSCYGEYLSRRMLIKSGSANASGNLDTDAPLRNLSAAGGTMLDAMKLVACLLESTQLPPKDLLERMMTTNQS